jgi:hypothetical protein
MDDTQAFMELSALLTGLYDPLLNDPEDRALNRPVAEEYARRLKGTFPQEFPALLEAYKALASVDPKPPIDDALLAKLRATQAFKDNEIVANMGDDPKDSVVDRWGRAHDVPNLWIVGSSVFTTSATANPTMTLAALTLRTATAIHRHMQGGA